MNTSGNQQQHEFDESGFVAFRGFLQGAQLQNLTDHVDRLAHEVVPSIPREQVFYEDKCDPTSLKQIQHLGEHDAWFGKLFAKGPFRETAEWLLGKLVVPVNLQYFNKPPQRSQPTPPHQDGYYFMIEPCEAVTMWLALDDVDEENGCVRYVQGSHRLGMREHARTQTLGFSQGICNYPSEQDLANEVAITASPGDLLVHHAMTIHRADQNRSVSRNRRALGFIYYSVDAKADKVAHQAYQRRLADELKASGKL